MYDANHYKSWSGLKKQLTELKHNWNTDATLCDWDFLEAAANYLQLPVQAALVSDNFLIRILAVMDRRVGKRTIEHIRKCGEYKKYPEWVQQFYELRFGA